MTSSPGRKWRRNSTLDVAVAAALIQLLAVVASALSDIGDVEPIPSDFTGKSNRLTVITSTFTWSGNWLVSGDTVDHHIYYIL